MNLTTEHLTAFIAGGLSLIAVLRVVAPLTKTTRDDDAVAALDKGKAWVSTKAPILWAGIEVAGKLNALPAGAAKGIWYLEQIRRAYFEAHKSEIPKELEALAQKIAADISQEAKK